METILATTGGVLSALDLSRRLLRIPSMKIKVKILRRLKMLGILKRRKIYLKPVVAIMLSILLMKLRLMINKRLE